MSGKRTGHAAASRAARTLADQNASAQARAIAGSDLVQRRIEQERTSAKLASAAGAVLADPSSTPTARSEAASVLSQRGK